ncbi:MAG: hypothetical protein PHF20_04595 [Halothiobacillaceae bacterium]|nr:hypothetical protein [Halothiobacillaceae bacterium]
MADEKNNAVAKFDKDALRKWFALADVATMWGRTVDDLLHYGETNKLEICALFHSIEVEWKKYIFPTPRDLTTEGGGDITQNKTGSRRIMGGHFTTKEWDYIARCNSISIAGQPLRLGWSDTIHLARGLDVSPDSVSLPNSVSDDYSKGFVCGEVSTDSKETINRQRLVITREECERFEREHMKPVANDALMPAAPDNIAKARPGRPRDPNALRARKDELKADAIEQAKAFKIKHGKKPTIKDVAKILACSDTWCTFNQDTIEPKLRAAWWK